MKGTHFGLIRWNFIELAELVICRIPKLYFFVEHSDRTDCKDQPKNFSNKQKFKWTITQLGKLLDHDNNRLLQEPITAFDEEHIQA